MKIDFSEIRNVLAHVERLLDEHEGEDIYKGQIGASRRHDPKTTSLLSDLLAMQDCLRLADAEVSAIYWQSEGRGDPRLPVAPAWKGPGSLSADTNRRGGTSPRSVGRIQRVPQQHVEAQPSLTIVLDQP